MEGFFDRPPRLGENRIYARIRDMSGRNPDLDAPVRKQIEADWPRFGTLTGDRHFLKDAQCGDFLARYWELSLAMLLDRRGHKLVTPRGDEPDICIDGRPRVLIECSVVTRGQAGKPDYVPEPQPMVAYDAPERQILLRMTSALRDKANQQAIRLAKKKLRQDDILIVALSGAHLGMDAFGGMNSYAQQAVLGLGPLTFKMNRDSQEVVDHYAVFSERVEKRRDQGQPAEPISTSTFLTDEYAHISALLWSPLWDGAKNMGANMVLVHNYCARNPLPRGYFAFGTEVFAKPQPNGDWQLDRVEHFKR